MLTPSEKRERRLGRIGLGVCLMATLVGVWLHVVYLTHAGALWRDEAASVQLASSANLRAQWRLASEYFPVFFFALVRAWSALGLGSSDFSLRILGFLIGLSLLGGVWLNARIMGYRWPFISLGLLAANLALVRWGDSLRAYGCGALFIMLTLGLMWRLIRAPGRASFVLASLAAILSVQTLYHNAVLVLAACIAGCATCALRRQWKTALTVLTVGFLAAVSLTPYVAPLVEAQDHMALHKTGFQLDRVWATLALALGSDLNWPLLGWFGLAPFVLGAAWETLLSRGRGSLVGSQDLPVFAVAALGVGTALFFAFLRLSEFPTQPWYFLPLMAFAACAMDAALGPWCRQWRVGAAAFVLIMVCVPFPAVLKLARYRQTNIDVIAAELHRHAQPGDFIVVSPCYCGITFDRYYKGPAVWTTLPPVDDHRFHRTDLMKERLSSKLLLQGVLDQAAQTLSSGHTLWVVAALSPPEAGEIEPPELPPATLPGQPFGYVEGCVRGYIWERQVAHLIDTRAEHLEVIVNPQPSIIQQEELPLVKASGWRGEPAPATAPR